MVGNYLRVRHAAATVLSALWLGSAAACLGAPQPPPPSLPTLSPVAPAPTSAAATAAPPPAPLLRIRDIQGAAHLSPRVAQVVAGVGGIVTARRSDGFYMQDNETDGDDATSEAIFVATGGEPGVSVGDRVRVGGTVAEARPGAPGGLNNLTITQIQASNLAVVASGNPLPPPIILGAAGRPPPTEIIEDDAQGEAAVGGVFDPLHDGLDFYESLEGMRVQIHDAVVVGPRNSFGEIVVLADQGAGAGLRTPRGGIVTRATDFNPERFFLDDEVLKLAGQETPIVSVADRLTPAVVGVVDYSFGNYKVQLTQPPGVTPGGLTRERATPLAANQLAVATFNVQNLDPTDIGRFEALAELVVAALRSPDILVVEEVQDNNGRYDDRGVDASRTWARLIDAIQSAGGPTYAARQIDPIDDQDGGEPGGNIRQGFLFRADRGVQFVDRPGGTATSATTLEVGGDGPRLSFSPGRVDPQDVAFANSRKPLAAEFDVAGQRLFLIANHQVAKGADQPLFGRFQPPERPSETPRLAQAQVLARFVTRLLEADPEANILVLGDLNDFEFAPPLRALTAAGLTNLTETLAEAERYTYVFEGNSQALDHILVSPGLMRHWAPSYDVVHINAEFAERDSDHDPTLVRLTVPRVAASAPASTPLPAAPLPTRVAQATARPSVPTATRPGVPPVIAWSEAAQWIGQTVTAEGTIVLTRNTGRVTYLNFSPNFTTDLKVVIFPAEAARFPSPPEELYRGRRIRVSGLVREYNGAPEIIVRDPQQIELLP